MRIKEPKNPSLSPNFLLLQKTNNANINDVEVNTTHLLNLIRFSLQNFIKQNSYTLSFKPQSVRNYFLGAGGGGGTCPPGIFG
jgi:hypothetical protein